MVFSSIFGRKTKSNKPTIDNDRHRMVEEQIISRGVRDEKVLNAMKKVPRHLFIPTKFWDEAYEDHPIPIEEGQTISQPYIVAYMTELLELKEGDKVLEIGTGCGYQTAVLAEITPHIYSMEYYPKLADLAKETLSRLNYSTVQIKQGNGYEGWKEFAPYDAVIVTCAPQEVPRTLVDQLAEGGRMILPVGDRFSQDLYLVRKQKEKVTEKRLISVIFVPMLEN